MRQHKHQAGSAVPHRPVRVVVLTICLLWLAAFSLACRLAPHQAITLGKESHSLAQNLFGDTRLVLGSHLYTQADVYFHRGVPHQSGPGFRHDPFQVMRDEVSPRGHTHLEGAADIREIMPWLELSTRANPENPEAYLVAAFWLAGEAERPDLARSVLDRGQCNIPYSYEIQLAKGRLALHSGDTIEAGKAFDGTLAFWEETADAANPDHLLDKAEALLYRALLREIKGDSRAAIADLKNLLSISPDRPAMRMRLEQLESGKPAQPPARDLLRTMLRKHETHQCSACEDDEHGDDDS